MHCLSAALQKDTFGLIHKQKTVERPKSSFVRQIEGKAKKSPWGFEFKSCLHGQRLPGRHLDLSFMNMHTHTRVFAQRVEEAFTEHTSARVFLFSCVTIFSDSALTSEYQMTHLICLCIFVFPTWAHRHAHTAPKTYFRN